MAKSYSAAYNSTSDSNALEQRFYLRKEATRGTFSTPTGADFLYTLGGGSLSASQELNSSAHRSGRHNNNFIAEKRVEEFSFDTYFNFDPAAVNGTAAIDPAMKTLWESSLGNVETGASQEFIASPKTSPNLTFTLLEIGDSWAKQLIGGFIQTFEIKLPGDGQAQCSFSGMGGGVKTVGIGKSITANTGGNVVTVAAGEGLRFPVNSRVMIIKSDGVTRSSDTPDGASRRVTAVNGDIITLSGANLTTDSDGTALAPVYLCYYEPATPVGIDNPQTGLVGEIQSTALPSGYCFRNLTISGNNNHEPVNYCFGADGLDAPFFIPAGRLDISVSADLNMSKDLVNFYNKVVAKTPVDITAILGPNTGRNYEFVMPKLVFKIPSITVPDTGSIPVTFESMAYQTVLDAADELTVTVN